MKIIDFFCGVGGASMGYHRAGWEVIGIDIEPQPDYPFEFIQADAVEAMETLASGQSFMGINPDEIHAVHGGPPCQFSSALTKGTNKGREYIDLIPQTRNAFWTWEHRDNNLLTVIENVQGSELRRDLTLCGEMFGLDVIRHRYFETSFPIVAPRHKPHRGRVRGWRHGEYFDGPYVAVYGRGGGKGSVPEWKAAMKIDWTDNRKSIAEAIPPAFTEWLGEEMKGHLL
jgi:DNA (cytosine-5)-methyltransferase 1